MVTDSSSAFYNNPSACASQYYPATESDFSTWGLTTAWYAQNMGNAVATTHFVIDTSRNGNGANNMQTYATAPYNQPSSVIGTLASGNWCNPPGAGLGVLPTTNTGVRTAGRLPLGEDTGAVRRPVRRGRRRAGLGLRRLHPTRLADDRRCSSTVRPVVGWPWQDPGRRSVVPPAGPSVGPGRQPASAVTNLRGGLGPGQGSDRLSRVMPRLLTRGSPAPLEEPCHRP